MLLFWALGDCVYIGNILYNPVYDSLSTAWAAVVYFTSFSVSFLYDFGHSSGVTWGVCTNLKYASIQYVSIGADNVIYPLH